MASDTDKLAPVRTSVEAAINDLSSYVDAAGSTEMTRVRSALEMLGSAYYYLQPRDAARRYGADF